jgi:hypothetical protein
VAKGPPSRTGQGSVDARGEFAPVRRRAARAGVCFQEDELVISLVARLGTKKWSLIAQCLNGRLGKQCRERWYNHLDPSINKGPFTEDEDIQLLMAKIREGTKWAAIAAQMPGRTDNMLKNRYNSTLRRIMKGVIEGMIRRHEVADRASEADKELAAVEYMHREGLLGEGTARKTKKDVAALSSGQHISRDEPVPVVSSSRAGSRSSNRLRGESGPDQAAVDAAASLANLLRGSSPHTSGGLPASILPGSISSQEARPTRLAEGASGLSPQTSNLLAAGLPSSLPGGRPGLMLMSGADDLYGGTPSRAFEGDPFGRVLLGTPGGPLAQGKGMLPIASPSIGTIPVSMASSSVQESTHVARMLAALNSGTGRGEDDLSIPQTPLSQMAALQAGGLHGIFSPASVTGGLVPEGTLLSTDRHKGGNESRQAVITALGLHSPDPHLGMAKAGDAAPAKAGIAGNTLRRSARPPRPLPRGGGNPLSLAGAARPASANSRPASQNDAVSKDDDGPVVMGSTDTTGSLRPAALRSSQSMTQLSSIDASAPAVGPTPGRADLSLFTPSAYGFVASSSTGLMDSGQLPSGALVSSKPGFEVSPMDVMLTPNQAASLVDATPMGMLTAPPPASKSTMSRNPNLPATSSSGSSSSATSSADKSSRTAAKAQARGAEIQKFIIGSEASPGVLVPHDEEEPFQRTDAAARDAPIKGGETLLEEQDSSPLTRGRKGSKAIPRRANMADTDDESGAESEADDVKQVDSSDAPPQGASSSGPGIADSGRRLPVGKSSWNGQSASPENPSVAILRDAEFLGQDSPRSHPEVSRKRARSEDETGRIGPLDEQAAKRLALAKQALATPDTHLPPHRKTVGAEASPMNDLEDPMAQPPVPGPRPYSEFVVAGTPQQAREASVAEPTASATTTTTTMTAVVSSSSSSSSSSQPQQQDELSPTMPAQGLISLAAGTQGVEPEASIPPRRAARGHTALVAPAATEDDDSAPAEIIERANTMPSVRVMSHPIMGSVCLSSVLQLAFSRDADPGEVAMAELFGNAVVEAARRADSSCAGLRPCIPASRILAAIGAAEASAKAAQLEKEALETAATLSADGLPPQPTGPEETFGAHARRLKGEDLPDFGSDGRCCGLSAVVAGLALIGALRLPTATTDPELETDEDGMVVSDTQVDTSGLPPTVNEVLPGLLMGSRTLAPAAPSSPDTMRRSRKPPHRPPERPPESSQRPFPTVLARRIADRLCSVETADQEGALLTLQYTAGLGETDGLFAGRCIMLARCLFDWVVEVDQGVRTELQKLRSQRSMAAAGVDPAPESVAATTTKRSSQRSSRAPRVDSEEEDDYETSRKYRTTAARRRRSRAADSPPPKASTPAGSSSLSRSTRNKASSDVEHSEDVSDAALALAGLSGGMAARRPVARSEHPALSSSPLSSNRVPSSQEDGNESPGFSPSRAQQRTRRSTRG